MPAVLTDLDAIDWVALGSATGTATRVPAMLRTIVAGVDPAASTAVEELFNELYHQETVWACTGPAVPFLVELVLEPSVSHRATLTYLLGSLSRSSATEAVDAHVPRLVGLLADSDAGVREYAAYLLGRHANHTERTLPMLLQRWSDEPEAAGTGVGPGGSRRAGLPGRPVAGR